MCLELTFTSKTTYYKGKTGEAARRIRKVAEKDIKVIKILTLSKPTINLYTPFYHMKVELNVLYTSKFTYGYSGLTCRKIYDKMLKKHLYLNRFGIESGLHSCQNIVAARRYYRTGTYYNAIIPAGTRYFLNEKGLIASEALIITGEYKQKK